MGLTFIEFLVELIELTMVLSIGTGKEYFEILVNVLFQDIELIIIIGPNRLESTKKLSQF